MPIVKNCCMDSSIKERKIIWITNICGVLFLALCIITPYILAHIGINFTDEPYQILLAANLHNAPFSFLTSILARWWGDNFGWEILSMRYFAITMQLIPFLIGCYVMWRNLKRFTLCTFISGMCILLMNGMFNFTLMGWDATSNGCITCIGIILFFYCRKSTFLRVVLLGLFSGMTICMRLPNVVIIPIVISVIGISTMKTREMKTILGQELVYLMTLLIIVVATIMYSYESIPKYIESVQSNQITAHSAKDMLEDWIGLINYVLPFVIILLFGLITIKFAYSYSSRHSTWFTSMVCIGWLLVFFELWWLYIGIDNYLLINHLSYAFFVVLTALTVFKYAKASFLNIQEGSIVIISCIGLLCLSLVSGVGSNCGINKILALNFIPLIMVYLMPVISRPFYWFCGLFLTIICPTLCVHKWSRSYHDVGIHRAEYKCDAVKQYKGLYTSEDQMKFLIQLNEIVQKNRTGNNIYIAYNGPTRFAAYYLNGTHPQYALNNWTGHAIQDDEYILQTKEYILSADKPINVFVLEPSKLQKDCDMLNILNSLKPIGVADYDIVRVYRY